MQVLCDTCQFFRCNGILKEIIRIIILSWDLPNDSWTAQVFSHGTSMYRYKIQITYNGMQICTV